MRISELAGCVDESASTIRFYESIGLLPAPRRTPGGYRDYDRQAIDQIRLIRSLQWVGFSLEDISTLFAIRRSGDPATNDDLDFIAEKRTQLDAQLDAFVRACTELDAIAAATLCTDRQTRAMGADPRPEGHQRRPSSDSS